MKPRKYNLLYLIPLISLTCSDNLQSNILNPQIMQFDKPETINHRFKRDATKIAENESSSIKIQIPTWNKQEMDDNKISTCNAKFTKKSNLPNGISDLNIKTNKYSLVDNNPSVSLAWHGDQSGVVLAVTSQETFTGFLTGTDSSKIYKSHNFGKSFTDITPNVIRDLKMEKESDFRLRKNNGVITMNLDTRKVILLKAHQVTSSQQMTSDTIYINKDVTDDTSKFESVTIPFVIDGARIEQHPYKKDYMLAVGTGVLDEHKLWITTDGGYHWRSIDNNVYRFRWDPIPKSTKELDTDNAFYYIKDNTGQFLKRTFHYELFRAEKWSSNKDGSNYLLAVDVYSFGVQEKFLYVSVLYKAKTKAVGNRIMLISSNHGAHLRAVQLPDISHNQFYAILDFSEGMVFIHVDNEGDTGHGNIYASGEEGVVFDLSLEKHLYPNSGDLTDFYRVDAFGSNGTYITSQLLPELENAIQTMITYDRGISWHPIDQSSVTNGGTCVDKQCNLQIHNRFSISKHVHVPKGPISSKNAPGLIMAHGNMGDALAGKNIDVYVSQDGGYNWYRSLHGTYNYRILNHGKVLIAIASPEYGDKRIDTVKISLDRGHCWFDYKFTDDPIEYTGMIVEPGDKQSLFSIWGWGDVTDDNKVGNWVLYHMDLDIGACTDSDYAINIGHCDKKSKGGSQDSRGGEVSLCCRLGETVSYKNVKEDSVCVVSVDFIHSYISKSCQCTKEDFSCGYGYERKNEQDEFSPCTLIDESKSSKKLGLSYDICHDKDSENASSLYTSRYRQVPGDRCIVPKDKITQYTQDIKQEEIFLTCLEQQEEKGINPSEDCVTFDVNSNRCLSQKEFETMMDGIGNINHYLNSGKYSKIEKIEAEMAGGHGWAWFIVLLLCIVGASTYYFYYKEKRLPGIFSRFNRYTNMNTQPLDLIEDEPPLDLTDDRYRPNGNDEDDILA